MLNTYEQQQEEERTHEEKKNITRRTNQNASQQKSGLSRNARVRGQTEADEGGSADVPATDTKCNNLRIWSENSNRMSIFIVIISFNDRWLTLWL